MKKIVFLLLVWCTASSFTLHLMGDSTMADKDLSNGNPERGWGMLFRNFVDGDVQVINYAKNGLSTRSCIDKGIWAKVYAAVQPGDYVLIEFGHNDGHKSDSTRFTEPWGDYSLNLRRFVQGVREKGGIPVLMTPVARRWFKDGRLDRTSHGEYPAAMKAVARETGTVLIDMEAATQDWLASLGDEASRPYYMHLPAGKYACAPQGKTDNTHTVASGARKLAEIACDSLRVRIPAIGAHLVHYDIVVGADGCGDYMTVQEGINAIPDYSHDRITRVFIRAGVYKEEVIIPHSKFRVLICGQGADKTLITYDKYARQLWPGRDFEVGTSGSASVYVHASYITFEDLTFENSAGEGKGIDQAVAVFTDGDFLFFHRCRFIGNQDTLYTYGRYGKNGGVKRNYYLDCYIEGTTDFIFGPSVCYFENCTLHSKKNSYVTAASTFEGQPYGYVFKNCTLTAAPGVDKCYLGRPWGAYATTVFLDCTLGGHILPEGWHDWEKPGKPDTKKNSFYAEYGSKGPGARGARVKWAHTLRAKDLEKYSFEKVMYQAQDGIVWNPFDNR